MSGLHFQLESKCPLVHFLWGGGGGQCPEVGGGEGKCPGIKVGKYNRIPLLRPLEIMTTPLLRPAFVNAKCPICKQCRHRPACSSGAV